jgi:succinoglycan biosynthesis transport protein ExoP
VATGTAMVPATARAVQLLDYIRTLYRHRWTALTAFAVIVVGVTIYTFTATPIFEGRVQVLIEPENPNVISFKEVVEVDKATNEYYQTQYGILKSRALARRTIAELKLWENPEFASVPSASVTSIASWFNGSNGKDTTPAAVSANETAAQSRLIDALLKRLTIAPVRNSRLVDLRFQSKDPVVAANVANTLAHQYVEQNLEFKFMSSKEASDWLGQQLGEQRKKVEESELALQKYREKGDAIALEDRQNIVVQRLSDLNQAVTKARTDRIEKEAVYRQLEAIQANRVALDTFPAILSNTFIQQLKSQLSDLQRQQAQMAERLGEKHPDIIKGASAIQSTEAKLQAEIYKVVQSVKNEFLSAQSQEKTLAAALESQKTDALALNRSGIEYGVLSREAESNKQIYQSLMQRTKETTISGELKTSNIRVVDAAEIPRSPVAPKKTTNLLLAIFGGALGACGLAFFIEYLDNKIKSPDEIKNFLGVPFLGLVPNVPQSDTDNSSVAAGDGIPVQLAESFRTVRTNVLFSVPEDGHKSVLVTSTAPSEGKSLIASNLAIALAQAGNRTVIIDCDMRKPRIHEIFGQKQEPGLSSLIVGNAKGADTVLKTRVPNLWIMPAGPHPPNPAELLGSPRFRDVLASMTTHFDWVILDSPPVMAVTDATLLSNLAGGVLFVIGSERISRHAAREALEQLASAKGTILGAVLNRADINRNPYYYSHYYRREYRNYYTTGGSPNS